MERIKKEHIVLSHFFFGCCFEMGASLSVVYETVAKPKKKTNEYQVKVEEVEVILKTKLCNQN